MKTIDEFGNIIIDNEPERYCYQYGDDVRDLIWTIENEKLSTCNVCMIACITGERPDYVLEQVEKIGSRRVEDNLIKYLHGKGYKTNLLFYCKPPDKNWSEYLGRSATEEEFEKIRNVLDKGTTLVMVHLYRHYLLCRGYIAHPLPGGKYSYLYVFNDSAGDMKLPLNLRLSSSGEKVIYPVSFLNNKQFYGGCYEVFV